MSQPTPAQVHALHEVIEPAHAVLYFASEVQDRWEALGMEPRGEGYVAGRAAPLGAIGPNAAAAIFFNFRPALFHRVLPGLWEKADPATVLANRFAGLQEVHERVDAPTDGLDELVELAEGATHRLAMPGRPLAAANADVAPPEEPFARAWQALAVLREHRGDGHVAMLTAAGLSGVEVLVLMAGWEQGLSRRFLQGSRMWDDEAWEQAADGLVEQGLLTEEGRLTDAGATFRQDIETDTDRLAAEPYERLGDVGSRRLFDLVRPLSVALAEGGAYPRPPRVPDAFPDA